MNQYIERIQQLRGELRAKGMTHYIVQTADPHQSEYIDDYYQVRRYLCGFTGSNGTLLITMDSAMLWTDGRYEVQSKLELEGTDIEIYITNRAGTISLLGYLENHIKKGDVIGFDGSVVSAEYGISIQKLAEKKNANISTQYDIASEIWSDRPTIQFNPPFYLEDSYVAQSCEEKCGMVREKMKEKGVTSLILSKLDDIMWLLNIRGRDIKHNLVAFSYLILEQKQIYYYGKIEVYTEAFRSYCEQHGIICKSYEQFMEELASYEPKGSVWIDRKSNSLAVVEVLERKATIVDSVSPTVLMKGIKSGKELEHMKEVYLKDSVTLTKFLYWVKHLDSKSNETEYTAGEYLDQLRSGVEGFLDYSFDTICAYEENGAMMHYKAHEATSKVLEDKGLLLVDSGAHYYGGTTDVTRTIALGEVSQEAKGHFSAVVAGMLRLQNVVFMKGCTGRNLDIMARSVMWKQYADYKSGTGHGIGYMQSVHEGPHVIRYHYVQGEEETAFVPGMLVSNEPGAYYEGKYGIRIENIILCREEASNADGTFLGFEPLTYVPIDLDAIDIRKLRDEDIENLNQYHEQVYRLVSPYLEEREREWLKTATRQL